MGQFETRWIVYDLVKDMRLAIWLGSMPLSSIKASPKGSAAPALTLLKGMLVGCPEAAFGKPQAGLPVDSSPLEIANYLPKPVFDRLAPLTA